MLRQYMVFAKWWHDCFGVNASCVPYLIELNTPEIAENGAIVPITIQSQIPQTERIFVFSEKNPQPLVSDYVFSTKVTPYVASRIKMAETSYVHVLVLADGKFYRTAKEVKVTIGGCGEE